MGCRTLSGGSRPSGGLEQTRYQGNKRPHVSPTPGAEGLSTARGIGTASVRHAVWAGVVVLMLLLPAGVAWGRKASIPVLPAERNRAVGLSPLPSSARPAETVPRTSPVREDGGYASLDPIAAVYL